MAAWQRAGKFTVSAADSLPKSTPEGNKEERGGEEAQIAATPSHHHHEPPLPIFMHKQIRVREKIEGLRVCVGRIDEKSFGYLNFASSRCVRGCGAFFFLFFLSTQNYA